MSRLEACGAFLTPARPRENCLRCKGTGCECVGCDGGIHRLTHWTKRDESRNERGNSRAAIHALFARPR